MPDYVLSYRPAGTRDTCEIIITAPGPLSVFGIANPLYRTAPPTRLYDATRVLAAEDKAENAGYAVLGMLVPPAPPPAVTGTAIREWARQQGIPLKKHGRIPASISRQYAGSRR